MNAISKVVALMQVMAGPLAVGGCEHIETLPMRRPDPDREGPPPVFWRPKGRRGKTCVKCPTHRERSLKARKNKRKARRKARRK